MVPSLSWYWQAEGWAQQRVEHDNDIVRQEEIVTDTALSLSSASCQLVLVIISDKNMF